MDAGAMNAHDGIYLDNAATSWPKPESTYGAVEDYLRRCGGAPARGRHPKAQEAGRILEECRRALGDLLGAGDTHLLALTSGATEALNLALRGLLPPDAHVVVTELEHNSVMRPLSSLARERGVRWTVSPAKVDGRVDPAAIRAAIVAETRMVVVSHASNVLGTRVDVEGIAAVARERGIPLLVDAAQTAGALPIDVSRSGIDLLAFTGHKSLLGPQGTGGLLFRRDLAPEPILLGGTGTFSERPEQPEIFPDRYQAGTPNMPGIAGLLASVRWVESKGIGNLLRNKSALVRLLAEGLRSAPGVRVFGTDEPGENVGILSFAVDGLAPEEAADRLWERGRIMVRAGLHCAPFLHRRIGTEGSGTIRVGVGFGTSAEEIRVLLESVRSLR